MNIENVLPFIAGISGIELTNEEKNFLKKYRVFGIILFSRNIDNAEQVKNLTTEIKTYSCNSDIIISIDEEGGRVSRLNKIYSPLPAAKKIGELFEQDPKEGKNLLIKTYQEIAHRLLKLNITMCYAPVCDISYPITHDVIGDRAFSDNLETITELAGLAYKILLKEGVYPVIKHIPGHGLARSDSHLELPIINDPLHELENKDFAVFKRLNDCPFAMSAHILYESLDAKDPVTISEYAISYIRNKLNFQNILISDDLNMQALTGCVSQNAVKALDAGCDIILHCNGKIDEILAIAELIDKRARSFQV